MSENHEVPSNLDTKLKFGLVLNTSFTLFEFVVGFLSGSLALVSDAAHNLTDSLSLIISFTANKLADKPATFDKTYGYRRATILAALCNALILLLLALYIFHSAYQRILSPAPVEGNAVMIVAFLGLLINGGIAFLFSKSKNDLNMKSAFISMALDALASVGALIAGFLITLTNQTIIDPIMSILIGGMLLLSGYTILKEALHVLLDGVPEGVDLSEVKATIVAFPKVRGVDDLHVWALSTKESALSCHLVVTRMTLEEVIALITLIKETMAQKFHITHAVLDPQLTVGPHDRERMDEGI